MPKSLRLYIDESGDHTYGKKELKLLRLAREGKTFAGWPYAHYPELKDEGKRYLGLTGCIVETDEYRKSFHPNFEELKQRHFPHSPDEQCLYSRGSN